PPLPPAGFLGLGLALLLARRRNDDLVGRHGFLGPCGGCFGLRLGDGAVCRRGGLGDGRCFGGRGRLRLDRRGRACLLRHGFGLGLDHFLARRAGALDRGLGFGFLGLFWLGRRFAHGFRFGLLGRRRLADAAPARLFLGLGLGRF